MRLKTVKPLALLACMVASTACGNSSDPQNISDAGTVTPDAAVVVPTFRDCEDSDQAFVRRTHLALLGHRPKSQSVVNVYADLMAAVRLRNAGPAPQEGQDAGPPPTPVDPKTVVVELLSRDPAFVDRWSEQFMDLLLVSRIEDQSQQSCYGDRERADDNGDLAAYVRDNQPTANGDGGGRFTMLDLVRSSLALDDVSPIYRAHLFALVSRPIPAANVPRVQAELARREDFGNVFDAAYLNRDMDCLGCHNSTNSITFREDPATNRHWDIPGRFEEAIYGQADGIGAERAHAAFRFDGFVAQFSSGEQPWGWDTSCGEFLPNGLEADPAGVDGRFASLAGQRVTAYELEQALHNGFSSIALDGLALDDSEGIADVDAAFAYLVAANIVDGVWAEVMGSRLTIANHFPRNQESRDILHNLTEEFVRSSFSVQDLLTNIVSTPYFNRLPAEAGCGVGPYNMPPVFDPWTIEDDSEERRNNGPGDGVHALSARTLLSSAYEALDWRRPFFESFPERPSSIDNCAQAFPSCTQMSSACDNNNQCCFAEKYWCDFGPSSDEPGTRSQRTFLRGIGVFLKNGDKGFRGLDFQARLVFEDRFADCRNVDDEPDFLDAILTLAEATPDATLGDVVSATKDRLVGTARIRHEVAASGMSEKQVLETLFATSLDTPIADVENLESKLRGLCGTLLSTPQFLLGGMAAPDSRYEPLLTPEGLRYTSLCEAIALPTSLSEHALTCSDASLGLN